MCCCLPLRNTPPPAVLCLALLWTPLWPVHINCKGLPVLIWQGTTLVFALPSRVERWQGSSRSSTPKSSWQILVLQLLVGQTTCYAVAEFLAENTQKMTQQGCLSLRCFPWCLHRLKDMCGSLSSVLLYAAYFLPTTLNTAWLSVAAGVGALILPQVRYLMWHIVPMRCPAQNCSMACKGSDEQCTSASRFAHSACGFLLHPTV